MRCPLLRDYFIAIQSVCSSFSRLKYILAITIQSRQYKVSFFSREVKLQKLTRVYDNNKNTHLSNF